MKRILEAQVMEDVEQAKAYADADFEFAYNVFIHLFDELCSSGWKPDSIIDLGCGPGDILLKLAETRACSVLDGVDASGAMLDIARKRKNAVEYDPCCVKFYMSKLPSVPEVIQRKYDAIISNSFLHHLPQPEVLWDSILKFARKGSRVLVMDLLRTDSEERAAALVEQYASGEPLLLQRDFYNSLCAAFTVSEIREQLRLKGLDYLSVDQVSDRHVVIKGEIN